MNLLQNNEFIGPLAGNADDKVQAGVPPVNEFVLPLLDNVAHLGRPGEDVGGDVAEDPALVGFGVGREELGQANLALSGHEDDEIPSDGLHGCFEVVEVHFPCVLRAACCCANKYKRIPTDLLGQKTTDRRQELGMPV